MSEKQNLLQESNKQSSNNGTGSTFSRPGLDNMWKLPDVLFQRQDESVESNGRKKFNGSRDLNCDTTTKVSYQAFNSPVDNPIVMNQSVPPSSIKNLLQRGLAGTPALIIAILLNLFFGVSFGQVFFPTSWNFPDTVPRAIGVQMFLISTMICQVTMTLTSSFPMAFGMMMVENVPFMHVICNIATDAQGMGKDTFATVFVAFAISTISVGAFFYLLGHFKMGNVVYFFPKHVIVGCIGGIGIFLFTTGMEGSTNRAWKWEIEVLQEFFSFALIPLWVTSLCFELLLRLLSWKIKDPLLAPFFFVSIPFIFYIALLVLRIPIEKAHQTGWFFEGVVGDVDPFLIWELIDFKLVNWYSVLKSAPTIVALTVFSLMHVPINIPSLSVSTGYQTDMNKELKAHGISNLLSGCCGGLQNYVCYCNSVTYFKCNGGGILSGLLLASSSCVFFVIGPSAVVYVPRCMAGCLLMHIGTELTKEALWDSIGTFDVFEYGSVVAITIVMTAYGMTAGLALGVICATLTFTLQTSRNVPPIRAIRSACTLRSSRWRSQQMKSVLNQHSASISVVQLQGNLFFGNATLLSSKVEAMLQKARTSEAIRFVILDFTLVLAIDSSAAETIGNIYDICDRFGVRLCYSRSSKQGLPCALKLAKKIKDYVPKEKVEADIESSNIDHQKSREKKIEEKKSKMSRFDSDGQQPFRERDFIIETPSSEEHEDSSSMQGITIGVSSAVHVADSLDEGLAWCEDVMIKEYLPMLNVQDPFFDQSLTLAGHRPIPAYLRQLHALCPFESADVVNRLFSKFVLETVKSGCVLWKQGDESNRAVLLCRGRLSSTLEEEGEELVVEDIPVGHLVGEYGLINNTARQGTLTALDDSELYVLSRKAFEKLAVEEPYLAFTLSKICMAYLGHRVMHVSNRIWESRCLPV